MNSEVERLQSQLSEAEEAETELGKLETAAREAPALRQKLARLQTDGRLQDERKQAYDAATAAQREAQQLQEAIPELIAEASRACHRCYVRLVAVRQARERAWVALQSVDHCDYLVELEARKAAGKDSHFKETDLMRIVATEHGSARVRRLLDELAPELGFLAAVDRSDVVQKDTAAWLLSKAIPPVNMAGLYGGNGYA